MEKILNYKNAPAPKVKTNSLEQVLATSMPETLNIYQRANLVKSKALPNTSHDEFKIVFGISKKLLHRY